MTRYASLRIAEIFASLQGEGPYMGQPAVFVRLAGCLPPLCPWCDTPHAQGDGISMTTDAVLGAVLALKHPLVVITGGEPFLQWESGLLQLADMLACSGRRMQYETSGRAGIPDAPRGIVVCSPKPEPAIDGTAPASLHLPAGLVGHVDAFKFVVAPVVQGAWESETSGCGISALNSLQPVLQFVQTHGIRSGKVWLMPFGATRQLQHLNTPAVWELCVQHGFNFSPRLHVLAFDDRKGV